MDEKSRHYVAVIGAGPAGLFAARELAEKGVRVVLLNRDIKPGGLAEYGIYPTKLRMKDGLRNQFRQIWTRDDVDYYGNVTVGDNGDLRLDDLRALGFHAILVTVGAQSTKWLGIPGEDLVGVYHAKDIVYHYNLLPPFSDGTYQIGKRVAVIGVGNVMLDITHWLVEDRQVEEVIAIARRGPAEVKFDKKELEAVVDYLDRPNLEVELERVTPIMARIGQDPGQFRQLIDHVSSKAEPRRSASRFSLRFLTTPLRMLGDSQGKVVGLEIEENTLEVNEDGGTRARGLGIKRVLDVDTVIYAIGDVVDMGLGLPISDGEFTKHPQPLYPIDGVSYEAYDQESGQPLPGVFLAGWARRPSTGLVGIARKDGAHAARAIVQYLQGIPPSDEPVTERVAGMLASLGKPVINEINLRRLELRERIRARELNLEFYKFSSNQQMLDALDIVKQSK